MLRHTTVDAYIKAFPKDVQTALAKIRQIIRTGAPDAEESIAYGMPAYKLNGKPLVYFAGYAKHIGFYATPTGHSAFAKELSQYKQGKGSVQFPLDKPIPFELIKRIVKFRVEENNVKGQSSNKSKPIHKDIQKYNASHTPQDNAICVILAQEITSNLSEAENKIWHGHPVWFLEGNPIVGYSKLKDSVRLLFWSGQSFDEPGLLPEGKFKAAEVRYTSAEQIDKKDLKRWLKKSKNIQWDYNNIVKRKGVLKRM